MLLFNLLVIASLLFLNGFFVAAEFALVGVRKTRIQQLANEGNFNAKLALDAVKNIDRYIGLICKTTNVNLYLSEQYCINITSRTVLLNLPV